MNRVQVSTYLSSDEDHAQWASVKAHYEGEGDSAILRQLIREKFQDIQGGSTKRQILPKILDELMQLKDQVGELSKMREELESLREEVVKLSERIVVLETKIQTLQ